MRVNLRLSSTFAVSRRLLAIVGGESLAQVADFRMHSLLANEWGQTNDPKHTHSSFACPDSLAKTLVAKRFTIDSEHAIDAADQIHRRNTRNESLSHQSAAGRREINPTLGSAACVRGITCDSRT